MAPTPLRHRLHVDDRQPAIRVDSVRQPDPSRARLESRRDPDRVYGLRLYRDVAGSDRGLVRRPLRPAHRRDVRGRARRGGLARRCIRFVPVRPLRWRADRRRGRRRGLRHLRRQRAEMVPGSPRPRCRRDGSRLWRRRSADGDPDSRDHRELRLPRGLLRLWPGARARHYPVVLVPSRARQGCRGATQHASSQGRADADRLPSGPGPASAHVLADVSDFRAGRLGWAHGRRPDRADRGRLWHRRGTAEHSRASAAGAHLGNLARPHPRWFRAPVLRLGLRHHRPREHDVHRVWRSWPVARAADSVGTQPLVVRPLDGAVLRGLRRNLQSFPRDLRRHVWLEIRDDERRPALHSKGDRGGARAPRQPRCPGPRFSRSRSPSISLLRSSRCSYSNRCAHAFCYAARAPAPIPCRSPSIRLRPPLPPVAGARFAAELKFTLARVRWRQQAGSARDRQLRQSQPRLP